jgi:hypothetical protein
VLQDFSTRHDLTTVISVGDIFWRPCTDAMYQRARDQFNGLRHPVIYTPGDNEWFDCWEAGSGGYVPQERLARLRQIFYTTPAQSLGGRRIPLVSQPEFVENVRWTDHFVLVFRHGASHRQRKRPAAVPESHRGRHRGGEGRGRTRRPRGCVTRSAPRKRRRKRASPRHRHARSTVR